MVMRIAKGKRYTYYKYGEYTHFPTAKRTARYWKRRNGSRYKITEEYRNGRKYYCVYLTKVMRG